MFKASLGLGFVAALAVGMFLLVPAWLDRPRVYDRSSPDAVVDSLATMVETGEAGRIPELLFAESDPMRQALARLGRLIDELGLLAASIEREMPREVELLRKDAEEAAERGEATSLLSRFARGAMQQRRSRNRNAESNPGDAFNLAVRQLLAQPLGTLVESRERLTTMPLTDTTAALLWDGQPVLPPFGVSMVLDESAGQWSIVLPLDLPFVSRFRPRTETQWQIVSHLFRAWENAARDVRLKIESGEIRTLDQAASEAGAMVMPPTLMIGVAYAKQMEESDGG
ncbi:MAG: hypothetical protein ACTS22_00875 [Phycisphaerales bacterium]